MARLMLISKLKLANGKGEPIMSLKASALAVAVAVLAALSVPGGTALATQVTRNFEFSSTSGPLLFGPNIGSFTYDDSVAPAGGGTAFSAGLFLDLNVSFGSWAFDETTANSGLIVFDAQGGLLEAIFGNNCGAGACVINGGHDHWWIRVGELGGSANDFSYSGYEGTSQIHTTNANRLLPLSVPEPGVLARVGLGFAALATTRRRKQ